MTIERQHLWPTTIYTFKLDTLSSNTNEKLSQTDTEFSELQKSLIVKVNDILSTVYRDDAEIRLLNSWANISRKGECTMPHIHEEASWSCVYYVTHTGNANIYFKGPRL